MYNNEKSYTAVIRGQPWQAELAPNSLK